MEASMAYYRNKDKNPKNKSSSRSFFSFKKPLDNSPTASTASMSDNSPTASMSALSDDSSQSRQKFTTFITPKNSENSGSQPDNTPAYQQIEKPKIPIMPPDLKNDTIALEIYNKIKKNLDNNILQNIEFTRDELNKLNEINFLEDFSDDYHRYVFKQEELNTFGGRNGRKSKRRGGRRSGRSGRKSKRRSGGRRKSGIKSKRRRS